MRRPQSPLFTMLHEKDIKHIPERLRKVHDFGIGAHHIMPNGHPGVNAIWPRFIRRSLSNARSSIPVWIPDVRKQNPYGLLQYPRIVESYDLELHNAIEKIEPLRAWLETQPDWRCPKEWPPYLWPYVLFYNTTPRQFGLASVTTESRYYHPKVELLRLWCVGIPEKVLRKVFNIKKEQLITRLIEGARSLVGDNYMMAWAHKAMVQNAGIDQMSYFELRHDIDLKKMTKARLTAGDGVCFGQEEKLGYVLVDRRFPIGDWKRQFVLDIHKYGALFSTGRGRG